MTMKTKNLYCILGVSENAAEAEIKKAYKILSKKYHPDANPGNKAAEEHFREITEAYAVLQNPRKRQDYDRKLNENESRDCRFGRQTDTGHSDRKHTTPFTDNGMFGPRSMEERFQQLFGFRPETGTPKHENTHPNKKSRTNPMDVSEMFERYMGIKK